MGGPFEAISDDQLLTVKVECLKGEAALSSVMRSLPLRAQQWINARLREGVPTPSIASLLSAVVDERRAEREAFAVELVWTGPSESRLARDTWVVVEQLFSRAQRSVLLSSFSMYDGRSVLSSLRERWQRAPSIDVTLVLNVEWAESRERSLREFAEQFVRWHWPEPPWPKLYFDPRSISEKRDACMHAKCIVVDDEQALVTSANLSESAQQRNFEAGVLLSDPILPARLGAMFREAIQQRKLELLPVGLLEDQVSRTE